MGREKSHDFGLFFKAFFVSFIDEIVFGDGFAGEELVGDWAKATSDDSESSSSDLFKDLVLAVHDHVAHC